MGVALLQAAGTLWVSHSESGDHPGYVLLMMEGRNTRDQEHSTQEHSKLLDRHDFIISTPIPLGQKQKSHSSLNLVREINSAQSGATARVEREEEL